MKKMVSFLLSCSVLLNMTGISVASAEENNKQPVRVTGAMEYGLAVRIDGDVSAIRQIGAYPVTSEPDASATTIRLTPFAEEEQLILDEIRSLSETNQNVSLYDTYCGTAEVVPQEQITDQVYYLSVTTPKSGSTEQHYQSIINSIAVNPDITYLGKSVCVTQCDHYSISAIYVYAPVSDKTEALLSADPRYTISKFDTELQRKSEPDIYVLKSADAAVSAIPYADYLAFKDKIESQISEINKISFSMMHVANYCSGCQLGLEIYPPKEVTGDLTGDEAVDINDAQLALVGYTKEVSKQDSALTQAQRKAADVNADGVVDVADAQLILLYYVKNTLAHTPTTWEELLKEK